jgi:hypothetical protein
MTYLDELRMQGTRALARHPELLHVWRDDGSLTFPPTADEGFEVSLHPNACAITVFTGVGWHHALDGEPTEAVEQALGLTRDLLSSDCRIREATVSMDVGTSRVRDLVTRIDDGIIVLELFRSS